MRISSLFVATAVLALPAAAAAQTQAPIPAKLPLKYNAKPTVPAITPQDLMSRLYTFADDSMMGRQAGTIYNDKGTAYIASEVKRLGFQPAGDNGTFFQSAHLFTRGMDPASTITVDGKTFKAGADFVAEFPTDYTPITGNVPVMYAGFRFDSVNIPTLDQVRGKIIIIGPLVPGFKQPRSLEEYNAIVNSTGFKNFQAMVAAAGAVVTVAPAIPAQAAEMAENPPVGEGTIKVPLLGGKPSGVQLTVTPAVADAMLGSAVATATKGAVGKTVTLDVRYHDTMLPGRNVVAILPGTDPKLKNEYVAIGAHNDHIGFDHEPIDHDSLRAVLTIARPNGAEDPDPLDPQAPPLPAATWTKINALKDSLRAAHGGVIRMDSIYNGADDDGTGSMGVLEIAEAFATAPAAQRPKRSLIFVWHVGEELGMFGSEYFTDHPTVPRDSIVTQLNVDMIGRGGVGDPVPWGGPSYLQLIGSHRLSTELGDIVEQVNKDTNAGFKYDYQFDANGDEHNYYCRSDHWAYARYGIPIAFFTTGGHRDYHQLTDEPQYIEYPHYARVAQLIHDIALRVGNLDHRPVVDHAKGDPYGTCQQ